MKDLTSVVIPAYNAAQYIDETIQSVINQDYLNWELIIINDGSKDNTLSVLEKYVSDSRISIYTQTNAGVSAARNHGTQKAKGKYISFLDADDFWQKDFLGKTIRAYELNSDAGLVHADMISINEESKITGKEFRGKCGWVLDNLLYWNETVISTPSGVIFKKDIINEIGGWDVRLSTAADQNIYFRIAAKYKVVRVPELLVFYRIHGHNMHTTNPALFEKDHLLAYRLAKEQKLFKSNIFERKCFAKLYYILSGENRVNRNFTKTIYYLLLSFFTYPLELIQVLANKRNH
jgi:glycosyltransferase involved in cell wall biosynthesis